MSSSSFAEQYRPKTLARVIGHDQAVTRLQGMINSGKIRNALGLFGSTSVGKTTLARAFAASVNGVKSYQALGPAYLEINAGSQKGIDDMRELERLSRYKTEMKYRVIVIDEAQMLMTNKQAAQAILKPLENPKSSQMIWVVCSMEPEAFQKSQDGRAMLGRLNQFMLKEPDDAALTKFAKRIAKGEEMTYMTDEAIELVVGACGRQMRVLADLMQSVDQYAHGLDKKPKKFTPDMISGVLSGSVTADDDIAQAILMGIYQGDFDKVLVALLDVKDAYPMVQKLLFGNSYLLYRQALGGKPHAWLNSRQWAPLNKSLAAATKGKKISLGTLVTVNASLTQLKSEVIAQGATFQEVAAARLFELVQQLEK